MIKKILLLSTFTLSAFFALTQISFAQNSVYTTNATSYCPALSLLLKFGDSDTAKAGQVSNLQRFIKTYYNLPDQTFITSGYFGNLTKRYVMQFQQENGIIVTGIVGGISRGVITQKCQQTNASGNNQDTRANYSNTNVNNSNYSTYGQSCSYLGNLIPNGVSIYIPRSFSGTPSNGQCLQDKVTCRNDVMTNVCNQRYSSTATVGTWTAGAFGNCVNSSQTREVFCQNPTTGVYFPESNCNISTKPALTQACTISNVATTQTVSNYYVTYLKKTANQNDLNYWSAKVDSGEISLQKLVRMFQVTEIYNRILRREPDASGLNYWVNQILNNTSTIAQVENGISNSQEARNMNASSTTQSTSISIDNFSITPNNASTGATTVFSWATRGANSCRILKTTPTNETIYGNLGQNGSVNALQLNPGTFNYSLMCERQNETRSANATLTVVGTATTTAAVIPKCYFQTTNNSGTETELSTTNPSSTTSNDICVSTCRTRLSQVADGSLAGFCRYVSSNGSEVRSTITPQATTGDGSCVVDGVAIPNGGVKKLFMFANGNPVNGAMNHDSCVNSSIESRCTNGVMLGSALGSYSSVYRFAKCYDNEVREDVLVYLLTSFYNNIFKRQPDAAGMTYWKNQIRASAKTMDEIENIFRNTANSGTDAGANTKPAATLNNNGGSINNVNPTISGTASNVSSAFNVRVILRSMANPALRIPYDTKPTVTNGNWTVTINATLPAGTYEVSLYDGNVSLNPDPGYYVNLTTNGTTNNSPNTSTNNQSLTQQITDLYQSILGRAPDTAGLNYWLGEVNANRNTIDTVRTSLNACKAAGTC